MSNYAMVNHLGEPCHAAQAGPGYYNLNSHFYHIKKDGKIVHINRDVINNLTTIWLTDYDKLTPITQSMFEDALRIAVFEIGIYEYVQTPNEWTLPL